VIGLSGLLASFIFLYPQLFFCEVIAFSGFNSRNDEVYYSPDIPARHLPKLEKIIAHSQMRVDSFYNGRLARPKIIVCSNPQQYQRYCSSTEGAGCSLGTPWGQTFVILNVQGANVDVIAHEMSHTELLARLGWWKVTNEIPQWFNEGLALMLDRRFVNQPDPARRYLDYMEEWLYYTGGGQTVLELADITSMKGFYNGSQQHVMLAYMSSGVEVSYWLTLAGKNGLSSFFTNIENGRTFENAMAQAEQARLKKYYKRLPRNPLRLPVSKKMQE